MMLIFYQIKHDYPRDRKFLSRYNLRKLPAGISDGPTESRMCGADGIDDICYSIQKT